MKFAIATAFAVMSLAGSAFADTAVTATIDTPVHAKLIAAHAVWNCDGATCVTGSAPDETASVSGCQDLAKKLGHVSSYVGDARKLDAKGLDKCNKSAAAPAAVGTASR